MKRTVDKRVGQLAAELVLREARAQRFGVILRDIEPIDSEAFINAALKKMKDEKFFTKVVKTHVSDPNLQAQMIKSFETDPPATN